MRLGCVRFPKLGFVAVQSALLFRLDRIGLWARSSRREACTMDKPRAAASGYRKSACFITDAALE